MTIRVVLDKGIDAVNSQLCKCADKLYRDWKYLINTVEDGDVVVVSSIRCLNSISYKELNKLSDRVPVILASEFCTELFTDEDFRLNTRKKILKIREQLA